MTKAEAMEKCYGLAQEYARKAVDGIFDDDLEYELVEAAGNFEGYEFDKNEIHIEFYDDHISVEDEGFYWEANDTE